MTRYRMTLEYDGGPFVGWQRQENGASVQAAVEEAVFGFSGERATVFAAGRTDAGVHALGQVAHVDLAKETDAFRVTEAVNYHLKPNPIAVVECAAVADDFHARFSAVERRYLYRIANRRAPLTLDRGQAWLVGRRLDVDAMHEGARHLVGHHDFSSFRAAECQADSPVRTMTELTVSRHGEEVEIYARAPSFLHHQIRNIAGSLVEVGAGKRGPEWIRKVLAARDRKIAGPTAPPGGLYLLAVRYPDD